MAQGLATGQRIEIRGFGSFDLNYRPPQVGQPQSGDRCGTENSFLTLKLVNCERT